MSVRANYFKLGLFVLGAMGAAIVVLLVVGSGRWFQPRDGKFQPAGDILGGQTRQPFTAPFPGDAVLHLIRAARANKCS